MSLTCNVGGADRTARLIVGLALLAIALFAHIDTPWRIVAGVVALIPLVTAAIGFCPMNRLLGINTCKPHP